MANGYTVEVTPLHNNTRLQVVIKESEDEVNEVVQKKHKQRSHRSYRNNVATAEHFQNKQILKVSQQKVMKEKKQSFTKLMGLFKKGEK